MSEYDSLSMRQKSLVDAMALNRLEDRGLTNEEILDLAHELHGEKRYSDGAIVSKYRSEYGGVVEHRVQVLANERNGGGETVTVGDPMRRYTGDPEGIDATMQDIADRPVKETGGGGPVVLLAVDEDRLFRLIRSEDEELARWAFDQVVGDE